MKPFAWTLWQVDPTTPRVVCGLNPKRKDKTMTTKPTLIAYTVKNRGKGQPAIWTKIGAAWPHSGGNGLSIELDAFPVDGRLVLIEPRTDDQANVADQAGGAQ